ncbi:MAG: hypothetical protein ACTTKN_04390 [Phocaeicola sp.]|uniref:hypothetical protein n=1 Tax=Phocaeicola sp. TaxID=2773926 RepID=UPI003FA13CD2
MKTFFYKVADLDFAMHSSENETLSDRLSNYQPFLISSSEDVIFQITIHADGTPLPEVMKDEFLIDFEEEGQRFCIYRHNDKTMIEMTLSNKSEAIAYLIITKDYAEGQLYIKGNRDFRFYALNNAMMMLYAFAGSQHHILLQHASVIKRKGKGYLFLGKSGTGKSTHSRLWLKYIDDTELLNDDNPAIGISKDGKVKVWGTPWSGKTPCYKNDSVEIGGFVRLWQAPKNNITPLDTLQAYATLLPTVSGMKWDKQMADGMNETLNELATHVPVFSLECLPDEAAAKMSFHALTGE